MKTRFNNLEPRWLLIIAFFAAGAFLGGLILYLWLGIQTPLGKKIHLAQSNYKYINPLIAVEFFEKKSIIGNQALELSLQSLIYNKKINKNISEAAVYLREIESGKWVGINENSKISPGKLLRIPIMIAYFNQAQLNPEILNETLTFKGSDSKNEQYIFQPAEPLKVGQDYTVNELIEKMIVDSDFNAANLLFDNINKNYFSEVFSDLGINFQEEKYTQDFIPLKLYSLFFRILYNSTYLNREFSEKALALLAKTSDNEIGISASLPKNISVAKSFGARSFNENGKAIFEMYNCGFVYVKSPYLLCVDVKGENLTNIKDFLKEVGLLTYKEMIYKYGE